MFSSTSIDVNKKNMFFFSIENVNVKNSSTSYVNVFT